MEAFVDRRAAGRALVPLIGDRLDPGEPAIVLALPRGGVPVADEVARGLALPLDVLLVRKLGVPGREELAFGALASGGVRVLNEDVVHLAGLTTEEIDAVAAREAAELARREQSYRGSRPPFEVRRRTAIVVDDGLATGATFRAAVTALVRLGAQRTIAAAPVCSGPGREAVAAEAGDVVCIRVPPDFRAVGSWYEDFSEVDDDTVRAVLDHSRRPPDGASSASAATPRPEA